MNIYSWLILGLFSFTAFLDAAANHLNAHQMKPDLPEEFRGVYDPEKYRTSLRYQWEKSAADTAKGTILTILFLAFLFQGGFGALDLFARSFALNSTFTAWIFVGSLIALRTLVALPFSIFDTFVIEAKYGFNRTTPQVFMSDLAKGLLLGALLGAPVLAAIQAFFEHAGPLAWLYSWGGLTAFQLLLAFLAPAILMPLFNRFSPLKESPLKNEIEEYSRRANFLLQGVFTMDGSKRSTKANAFFTGFGRYRRLVLFDTLIEKQSTEELTAVVAHEVGHFKCGHIPKQLLLGIFATGALFYGFSFFLENKELFAAFKMERTSVYASLVFISFLLSPLSMLFSIFTHWLSRRFEFEADEFSARTYGRPESLISALKKLSMDSLSNLTPHPMKVWLAYTHPPILERIAALRKAR
jgi:STE24 endopeptidase